MEVWRETSSQFCGRIGSHVDKKYKKNEQIKKQTGVWPETSSHFRDLAGTYVFEIVFFFAVAILAQAVSARAVDHSDPARPPGGLFPRRGWPPR